MDQKQLNQYSQFLVQVFSKEHEARSEKGMTVNPLVAELASWYEKLRNAIEYREEEVILRATIERILKRRLILGGNGEKVAASLVRELIWARYFPDGSIEEKTITEVEKTIDFYLELRTQVLKKHHTKEALITSFMYDLLSSSIERLLNPNIERQTMANFIFHMLQKSIVIADDTEEMRDTQVFIAIRKAYTKDDLAFLRYNLFIQFFGEPKESDLENIADNFLDYHKEVEKQLNYPLRHKIFTYVKRNIPPFLILDDILRTQKNNIHGLLTNDKEFEETVMATCEKNYNTIAVKVRRAIIRSVIFVMLSKVFFAFAIEGTYERIFYGRILWGSIALNVAIPSLLMVVTGFLIKTPGKDNSERILARIKVVLFDKNPVVARQVLLHRVPKKNTSILHKFFIVSWLATFLLSFGLLIYILSVLHFTIVSQGIFLFFFAIVSFLAYRINQTAKLYTVEDKTGISTLIVDFFFLPLARVGQKLTEGISQINIFLFILDYVIETPFKGLFSFFDQWFFYLHSKREDLG